jgi:hypothetical protein
MSMKTVEEIRPVKEAAEDELLKLPNVVGVDIGRKIKDGKETDELSILVLVSSKEDVPRAQMAPAMIDGVTTDVIERRYVLAGERSSSDDCVAPGEQRLAADTGRYDPLKGGISIGPCRSLLTGGTAGAIVRDIATNSPMLLSNFHALSGDMGWTVGDTMTQPSLRDTGRCPADIVATLQRVALNESVDAAVASIITRDHTPEIVEIGNTNGTTAATVNMAVRKRGRTTGVTFGIVQSLDLTSVIDFDPSIGRRVFKRQISIMAASPSTIFADEGDSGAVIVNSARQVVGLLFARQDKAGLFAAANPIQAVFSILNVKL